VSWCFAKLEADLPDLSLLRRNWQPYTDLSTTHEVDVRGVKIGGASPVVIAGPCAVESYEQAVTVARAVRETGVRLLRGGVFKPRTNPHDFQGLELEGLKVLAQIRKETGLGIVTEVMDPRLVETVAETADILQIGSRSMFCYSLLKEVGQAKKPILLKRHWDATLEEWLCSAEYIAKEGNRDIVLCERGIRASCHSSYGRYVLDLNILEPARFVTPLPVVVDPSHATGFWPLVPALSRAALTAGAHGLLIEAVEAEETDRSKLSCDREQGIPPQMLSEIVSMARGMKVPALPRQLARFKRDSR
jgi:3-deoxy-7-phosphoheptulonate synthase